MKNAVRVVLLAILLALVTGIVWWQVHKRAFVRHEIEKAVTKGTDSTYYVHYDSSRINALSGTAAFYNVVLQSDSLQQQLLTDDTTGLPATIFSVRVGRVLISGADIPSFLAKSRLAATLIELDEPEITIRKTGKPAQALSSQDSLTIYEKLTGKFKSIQAGEIRVVNGSLALAKGKRPATTTFNGIDIDLKNFRVDSTRNYDNIVSYFIKGIDARVKNILMTDAAADRRFSFSGVEYNAVGRFVKADTFTQHRISDGKLLIEISGTRAVGLSTNDFILRNRVKADSLSTNGGLLSVFTGARKSGSGSGPVVELDNGFFDEALVKNISVGKTTVTVYDRTKPAAAPLLLKNLQFSANKIDSVFSGSNLLALISKSDWKLSADGVNLVTADKVYHIDIGPFAIDKAKKTATIKYAAVIPAVSQDAFVRSLKFQTDFYNLRFNNIELKGLDADKIISGGDVLADEMSLQPQLNIFNDRTVPPDTASKIGQYPQQLLTKLKTGIHIGVVHANNAYVHYKERGALSRKTGDVYFTNISADISNFTNLDRFIQKDSLLILKAAAVFQHLAHVTTEWDLVLKSPNGRFKITGDIAGFDGTGLNPVIVPLGMGKIVSGHVDGYNFSLDGNDYGAVGRCKMPYENLKVRLLKNTGDSNHLTTKTATSLVVNVFMHDKNPSQGQFRYGDMAFKRVITKTFFNLVWKSIFAGAKSSAK